MVTEQWSYEAVLRYLSEATAGLISAPDEPLAPGRPSLHYTRSRADLTHFVPAPPRSPTPDQDQFAFDSARFQAQEGAADFVDAKRSYYARLPWIESQQAHALPYTTPSAWTTLNHPPIKELEGPLSHWTGLFAGPAPEGDPAFNSPYFDPLFQRALDEGGSSLTHGNRTQMLANGAAFREKMRLVADAKDHLYIAVMFWSCDASADQLTAALGERVRAGVDVRLMTEGLYRETITRRCIDRLEAAGVKVVSYRDALRPATFGAVLHWKVWIRDGEELIIGGQNIGNYESHSDGFNLLDRDNDVLVTGPAVTDAETAWIDAWEERGGEPGLERARADAIRNRHSQEEAGVRGAGNYARWLGDPATRMKGNCRVLMQSVSATAQPIGPIVEAYLTSSKDQVVFSSPTVRYDPHNPANASSSGLSVHRLMEALEGHGDGGGRKVVVITNGAGGGMGESQHWLRARRDGALRAHQWGLYQLSRQFIELVSRRSAVANRNVTVPLAGNPNLEVWTYFQYIHTKIWLFDRVAAMVGSWNLEINSTDKNPEAALVCLDQPLRDAVEADLALALVNSVPEVSLETARTRSAGITKSSVTPGPAAR